MTPTRVSTLFGHACRGCGNSYENGTYQPRKDK